MSTLDPIAILIRDVHRDCKFFTPSEENRLFKLAADGDTEATDKLILSVLPLAISVAKKVAARKVGVSVEDAVSVAALAVINCVKSKKFDPRKSRLTTYSARAVANEVSKFACNTAGYFRIPGHLWFSNPGEVSRILSLMASPCGFQLAPGGETEDWMADYRDHGEGSDGEREEEIRHLLNSAIEKLDHRSAEIVSGFYLKGETVRSLCQRLGLSRQRVYQIMESSLKLLRGEIDEQYAMELLG